MKHWMFNCREVSRKVSDSMDRPLPLSQRLMIRCHFMMCKYCARVSKQLKSIRNALRANELSPSDPNASLALSQDGRNRLKKIVRNAVKESG